MNPLNSILLHGLSGPLLLLLVCTLHFFGTMPITAPDHCTQPCIRWTASHPLPMPAPVLSAEGACWMTASAWPTFGSDVFTQQLARCVQPAHLLSARALPLLVTRVLAAPPPEPTLRRTTILLSAASAAVRRLAVVLEWSLLLVLAPEALPADLLPSEGAGLLAAAAVLRLAVACFRCLPTLLLTLPVCAADVRLATASS